MIRSFRLHRLAIAAILASVAAAADARVGPEIAYSTATEVYLVNLNGSGKVRLHRSRSNDFISSVALKPGGGTIAWVENWTLKFLDYNASGQPVGTVRTIRPACYRLAHVHFHPDGGSVLYQELCPEGRVVKSVAVPTATVPTPVPSTLFTNAELQDLGPWEPGGNSFLYTASTATHMELRRHYTDGTADPMAIRSATPSEQLRYPDISSDGAAILIAHSPFMAACCPGPGYTSEIDAETGAMLKPNFITGNKARYAPDNVRAVFIVADSYNARYLRYRDTDGQVKQIGGKGVYWSVDWGN
jgi:hypothetical protein